MTEQKFNQTKSELRSVLEEVAESVRKGELSPNQAKGFKPQIIELWMMEELGFKDYRKYSGMANRLVEMDLQSARGRQAALNLQIEMLQAELAEVRRHIEARQQLG